MIVKRILFLLISVGILMMVSIPSAFAYQQDFQNYNGDMSSSYTAITCGGSGSVCRLLGFSSGIGESEAPYEEAIRYFGDYNFNAYSPGVATYSFSQYIFYNQPQAATNFSYVMRTFSSGTGGTITESIYPRVVLKSAAGTTLATLTAPPTSAPNYHRISIQIIGNSAKMFIDGKYSTSATITTNPSYFYAGVYVSGSNRGGSTNRHNYIYIDDYIINPSPIAEFNIAEAIPQNWTVIIDDINPANNGLYDASGMLEDSNTFYNRFSKVSNASQTWQIQHFLTGTIPESLKTVAGCTERIGNNVSSLVGKPTGLYRTFIDETGSSSYFWVTRYGATATWDDTMYDLDDNAILSYSITGGYWDTANYDYEANVISEAGVTIASQTISAASGYKSFPITEALYSPGGIYYGVINAVNKSTSADTYMAHDTMTVNDEISLQGYVMNATSGSPIAGALITVEQTDGFRTAVSSGGTGIYNITGMTDNYQLFLNTSKTGYWNDNHTFMPYSIKGYNVNISMIPETVAVSGAALIGRAYEKPYFNPIHGATLLATNTTHGLSNTTTSNIAGGYSFDGLPASELMNDYGSLSGYVADEYPYRINTSALGSYVIQDVDFSKPYNLSLTFRDATTHALILTTVTVEYNGAASGTTTTTIGIANISSEYGIVTVIVSAEGYYGATDSYLMDTDRTDTIYLTQVTDINSANLNLLYPREVRFLIVDRFGNKQTGVNVSAVMTSSPTDDTNWLSTLFGISNQATPINSTVMYDQTDDYGSVVFPMIASAKYTLTFTKASAGISESRTIHPDQTSYTIVISTTASAYRASKSTYITLNLSVIDGTSDVWLVATYNDTSFTTTSINYFINFSNQTPYKSFTFAGNNLSFNHIVNNTKGASYTWGLNTTSSTWGASAISQGITLRGIGGMLVDPFDPTRTGWD